MSLARTTRFSRHARIPGDCPVCLYPLQGRNITQRPCQHMLCTPCYHDGVQLGLKDSSFNPDACEQCRNTPCTMTRHGSTLMEHFASSKFTKQLAVATSRKDESQGRLPQDPSPGPSAFIRVRAKATERKGNGKKTKRLKKRKAGTAFEKANNTVGGFTKVGQGKARKQGVHVPVGDEHTCLKDAMHTLMHHANPSLELGQQDPFAGTTDNCDPSISMASDYAAYHGMMLQFKSDLNNPAAVFRQRNKGYLVRLAISADVEGPDGTDYHFVAYLADLGFVVDNYPGRPVLAIDDSDRSSNDKAIQVFYDLFPGAQKIQMTHAYCLEQMDRKSRFTCGLLFEPATTRSTPPTKLLGSIDIWSQPTKPTIEDLFLELYDQEVINYGELVDCTK